MCLDNFRVARDASKIPLTVPVLSVIPCLQQLGIPSQQEDSKLLRYCNLAYSTLACSKKGVSGSAPFYRPELHSFRGSVDESFSRAHP